MAISDRILGALRGAREGFNDFMRWWERGVTGSGRTLESVVHNLRQAPARDERKKAQLAEFFQTPAGQAYSKEEKRQAYDDLLGVQRNKENRG